MNLHDETEYVRVTYLASVAAVHAHFPHLTVEAILEPPHHQFDAALARQIAFHLLIARFDVPKRRLAKTLGRSRDALNRAIDTIDERLFEPAFAAHYERIAATARSYFDRAIEEEAA